LVSERESTKKWKDRLTIGNDCRALRATKRLLLPIHRKIALMPVDPNTIPTLRDFLDTAVAQGCKYGELHDQLVGARGRIAVRYLVSPAGVIYPLGNRRDDERLDPTTFLSMVRVLRIAGYEELIALLERDYLLPYQDTKE
jgi:hypothetical protein